MTLSKLERWIQNESENYVLDEPSKLLIESYLRKTIHVLIKKIEETAEERGYKLKHIKIGITRDVCEQLLIGPETLQPAENREVFLQEVRQELGEKEKIPECLEIA